MLTDMYPVLNNFKKWVTNKENLLMESLPKTPSVMENQNDSVKESTRIHVQNVHLAPAITRGQRHIVMSDADPTNCPDNVPTKTKKTKKKQQATTQSINQSGLASIL